MRSGVIGWQSPSNIALIKYWGKHGNQLPQNPSISFTLSNAFTETIIQYESLEYDQEKSSIDFYFDGKPNEAFKLKIESFIDKNIDSIPFLKKLHLSIESRNSFPHSSGIASSASSMSALALCLTSLEQIISGSEKDNDFLRRASIISRLASGSACRSVFGSCAQWGCTNAIEGSHDDYAIPLDGLHEVFNNYHDDILIVSEDQKSVSSTAGHKLMESNVYSDARFSQAKARIPILYEALKGGDLVSMINIVESEALTLHALMMCSEPSYTLMMPNTLNIINKLRLYREKTGHPVCFTLDAGPNVHILYPQGISKEVTAFIESDLKNYCQNDKVISDKVGNGPKQITGFSL